MRSGASISALLHTLVIILIVVGLPDILKSERQPLVAIAVEFRVWTASLPSVVRNLILKRLAW